LNILPDTVKYVKIGLELFIGEGPRVIALARETGRACFLDLKLHDIPRTVANAIQTAAAHDVCMLTVHAQGGPAMLRAAADAAAACGKKRPRVIAVTTLTSLNQDDLTHVGVNRPLAEHTLSLGKLALESGCDGLVCSPLELAILRNAFGDAPLLVAPGVRPAGADIGDQKRVATPAAAVRAGASFLVVGRPILAAANPASAAAAVLAEMASANQSHQCG
jgi:orotidine-5'-phosphate decarboxylase